MNEKVKNDCRNLWRSCFGDSEAYMDYYFDEKCKDNHILVDIEGDHVVSMVHLNPYRLKWQGKEVESYYIVGVATEEQFRKQGRMRELLELAFMKMRGERIPFTFLMPADKRIYEPFGFQTIYTQERIFVKGIRKAVVDRVEEEGFELAAAEIKKGIEKEAGISVSMRKFSELTFQEQEEAVSYCNQKLSKEFDIYAIRDNEYYIRLEKEMKASDGNVVVFAKKNIKEVQQNTRKIAGVIAYGMENGYLEVTESIIETELTQDIIKLLLQQKDIVDGSKIYFCESHFLNKQKLEAMSEKLEIITKDIIMAKILMDNMSFAEVFQGQRVYLNEIV